MSTDDEWEKWGRKDPYFGVITLDRFRRANLDDTARAEFFETGRWHVEYVWTICRRYVDAGFAPRRVLDFGCGVGRMLVHLARQVEQAVGVDVSPSMLAEAQQNCARFGAANVAFARTIDELPPESTRFDLVHSVIVLQHIDPGRGLQLFAQLLAAIAPGGFGAIQVTYAKMLHAQNLGVAPAATVPVADGSSSARRRGLLGRLAGTLGAPLAATASTIAGVARTGGPSGDVDPEMQMNPYNLNQLFFILQQGGIPRFHAEFTDHGGELGVFMFFQRPQATVPPG